VATQTRPKNGGVLDAGAKKASTRNSTSWSLPLQIAVSGLDTDWSNKPSSEKYNGGVHSRIAPLDLLPRLVCWTKAMLGFLLFLMGLLSRCCLMRPRESRLFLSSTYFNKHDADIPLVSHFLPLLTTCPRPSPLSIYPKIIMYYHHLLSLWFTTLPPLAQNILLFIYHFCCQL
jgi:hypothetical protein